MKTRLGFVSNSSSSSFVLITTDKTLKEVLNKFDAKQRKFIKSQLGQRHKGKMFGNDIVDYSNEYYTESISSDYETIFQSDPEMEEVDGCEHDFDRKKMKHCPECGEERYKMVEVDTDYSGDGEEGGLGLLEDFLEAFKGYNDTYAILRSF